MKTTRKELSEIYNQSFYDEQRQASLDAAGKFLPFLFNYYKPQSVIDIGCGIGTWLKVCQDLGIENIQGVDINTIESSLLLVPRESIRQLDLTKVPLGNNFDINSRYDFLICLEVAEHLEPTVSQDFIEFLTSLSDVIMFSAAIPYQVGTNHINCKPFDFWIELFKKNGFKCLDLFRPRFMLDSSISSWWYSQNAFLYVRESKLKEIPVLQPFISEKPIMYSHPCIVQNIIAQKIKSDLKMEKSIAFRIERKIRKLFGIVDRD